MLKLNRLSSIYRLSFILMIFCYFVFFSSINRELYMYANYIVFGE